MKAMSPEKIRSLVETAELFRGLDDAVLASIVDACCLRGLPLGDCLFDQGSPSTFLYFVLDGRLKVVHTSPRGEQITLRFTGPGELVGCAAVFRQIPYPASATAVTKATILGWRSAEVIEWVHQSPVLARNALHLLGGRVEELLHRVRELASEPVERRLANVVLRLLHDAGRPVAGGVEVAFSVTRQDLAEMTGATLFTVSRILSGWTEQRILSRSRQRIFVLDLERLQSLA
jgi:CRP-like cAMP-binding protein